MLKHQPDPALLRRQMNAAFAVKPELLRLRADLHAPLQAGAFQKTGDSPQQLVLPLPDGPTMVSSSPGAQSSSALSRTGPLFLSETWSMPNDYVRKALSFL